MAETYHAIKKSFYYIPGTPDDIRGVLKIGISLVLSLLERGRERLYKELFQFLEVPIKHKFYYMAKTGRASRPHYPRHPGQRRSMKPEKAQAKQRAVHNNSRMSHFIRHDGSMKAQNHSYYLYHRLENLFYL